jgi:GTPase SAR1 family protein
MPFWSGIVSISKVESHILPSMTSLKVVVAGPKSGKSTVVNYLSQSNSNNINDIIYQNKIGKKDTIYLPTIGCRIIECDSQSILISQEDDNDHFRDTYPPIIEFWDVSSNPDYEKCWPAIMEDCDALLLMYNPMDPTGSDEITMWFQELTKLTTLSNTNKKRLDARRCLVLMHGEEEDVGIPSGWKRPHGMDGVSMHKTTFSDGVELKRHVSSFLRQIATSKSKSNGTGEVL